MLAVLSARPMLTHACCCRRYVRECAASVLVGRRSLSSGAAAAAAVSRRTTTAKALSPTAAPARPLPLVSLAATNVKSVILVNAPWEMDAAIQALMQPAGSADTVEGTARCITVVIALLLFARPPPSPRTHPTPRPASTLGSHGRLCVSHYISSLSIGCDAVGPCGEVGGLNQCIPAHVAKQRTPFSPPPPMEPHPCLLPSQCR